MDEAGHRSCIVHTTGLPDSNILRMPASESMPWFTQLRCITSASLNSRRRVMSVPAQAVSISNRCLRENQQRTKMLQRSRRKCHEWRSRLGSATTDTLSLVFSATNSLAFTPLALSAFISRRAATAAPPVFSLVLTISTLIDSSLAHDGCNTLSCKAATNIDKKPESKRFYS